MATRRRVLRSDGRVLSGEVVTLEPRRLHAAPAPSALPDIDREAQDRTQTSTAFYDATKRALDLTLALAGIVFTLPFLVLITILIRIDSPGPIFFRQERLGRNAQPFSMLKFRTMRVTSDELPAQLRRRNESTGPLFKIRRDPRITRVGRLLRRTSLDELPQLLNVLAGQMSLVGPRPPLPRELVGYDGVQRLRLRVLPGLTGLWQISGRSDLPFEEMVRLDLRYIEERSLWLDFVILARTLPCVLTGRGAY